MARYLASRRGNAEWVFPELHGRYGKTYHCSQFTELLDKAGIDREDGHVTFHCLRHTFRTRLTAAGVPAEISRKLGGWTLEATAQLYDHDVTQLRSAINALD